MKNKNLYLLILLAIYLLINLYKLTALPIFADEAIYIRWSQLILDDWQRYLFYPMNDGKTPLLMWLMTPLLSLLDNQLLAARLTMVMIGLLASYAMFLIGRQLTASNKLSFLITLLFITSPFTFLYHRMALTDGLLLTTLLLAYYSALHLSTQGWKWVGWLALFFFLAIMSKTPAIVFAPLFYLTVFYEDKLTWKLIFTRSLQISAALGLSLLAFYSLRVVPLFTQLFAVGGNFLQEKEVIFSTAIIEVAIRNSRFFAEQLTNYLGSLLLFLALPWSKIHRKKQVVLLLSACAFLLPLVFLGKIIYPRYMLPSVIFLIASAGISVAAFARQRVLFILMLIVLFAHHFLFITTAYFNTNALPLSRADREQFLEEWSSGHGILESTALIQDMAKTQTVAVATEGFFGTLPDGILLNLHNQDVRNMYVEGIGQPVRSIPASFWGRAQSFDRQLLIVNSHRMELQLPKTQLLASFCRPNQAPCLEVWELRAENFK